MYHKRGRVRERAKANGIPFYFDTDNARMPLLKGKINEEWTILFYRSKRQ